MTQDKILTPDAPDNDLPPLNGNNKKPDGSHQSGFNLIDAIYSLLHTKQPIGHYFVERYKNDLSLRVDCPWLYFPFLIFAVIIDSLQALFSTLAVIAVLAVIVLSFAKGLGIFDWLPKTISNFASQSNDSTIISLYPVATGKIENNTKPTLYYLTPYSYK